MIKKLLVVATSIITLSVISTNTVSAGEGNSSIEEANIEAIVPYQSMTVSNVEYHTTYSSPGSFPTSWNTSVVGNNRIIYSGTLSLQRIERVSGNSFRGYYSGTLYNRPGTFSVVE